jgi:Uma2 family endonuclease
VTTLAQSSAGRAKGTKKVGLGFTVPELIADLGDIDPARIRWKPKPGTATVQDLIAINNSKNRGAIVELVNNTLVEKPMGAPESEAALELGRHVGNWNENVHLGLGLGADGIVQLFADIARAPDFAFYRHDQFPDGQMPEGQVPWMYPDLAVEILSPSNSKREMAKKRREYFAAGTRLVWEVDLAARTVVVYREPNAGVKLKSTDTLDGEEVLPGFKLPIAKWFKSLRLK